MIPLPNKVTAADVENSILEETYTLLPNGRTTICQLTLIDNGDSGFTVEGQSACVSKSNYDKALGEKIAREDALNKVWMLLGYQVAVQLQKQYRRANETFKERLQREYAELKVKLDALEMWIGTPSYNQLSIDEQEDQKEQLVLMRQYSEILDRRMARLLKAS